MTKFEGTGENRYVELHVRDHLTKNHRGGGTDDEESQGGRLYEVQNHRMCPVQSLKKYMLLLNQDYEVFFQRPKMRFSVTESTWYEKAALGKNTLGNKMRPKLKLSLFPLSSTDP